MPSKRKASAIATDDQETTNKSSHRSRRKVKEAQSEAAKETKPCSGPQAEKPATEKRSNTKTKEALRKEGVAARREVKRLKEQVGQLEKQVENLQKDYMALPRSQSSAKMDDDAIRNGLSDIKLECQIWSRQYAIRGPFVKALESSIKDVSTYLADGRYRPGPLANIRTLEKSPYGIYILLNMLLAQFMSLTIIDRPFFFLNQIPKETASGSIEKSLNELLKLIPESMFSRISAAELLADTRSEARTHTLTTNILQALTHPLNEGGSVSSDSNWSKIQNLKGSFYLQCARYFIKLAKGLLVNLDQNGANQCFRELNSIMRSIGELSLRIREPGLLVELQSYDSMELVGRGFVRHSNNAKPHHAMLLDESNVHLDGEDITLVIEPAIVVHIVEGGSAKRSKTLANAVVWVDGWERAAVHNMPSRQLRRPASAAGQNSYSSSSINQETPADKPTDGQIQVGDSAQHILVLPTDSVTLSDEVKVAESQAMDVDESPRNGNRNSSIDVGVRQISSKDRDNGTTSAYVSMKIPKSEPCSPELKLRVMKQENEANCFVGHSTSTQNHTSSFSDQIPSASHIISNASIEGMSMCETGAMLSDENTFIEEKRASDIRHDDGDGAHDDDTIEHHQPTNLETILKEEAAPAPTWDGSSLMETDVTPLSAISIDKQSTGMDLQNSQDDKSPKREDEAQIFTQLTDAANGAPIPELTKETDEAKSLPESSRIGEFNEPETTSNLPACPPNPEEGAGLTDAVKGDPISDLTNETDKAKPSPESGRIVEFNEPETTSNLPACPLNPEDGAGLTKAVKGDPIPEVTNETDEAEPSLEVSRTGESDEPETTSTFPECHSDAEDGTSCRQTSPDQNTVKQEAERTQSPLVMTEETEKAGEEQQHSSMAPSSQYKWLWFSR